MCPETVSLGSPVVFHCEETGVCKPALVTQVHPAAQGEDQPCVCLIAFCPETGVGHVKHNVPYVANAFAGDSSADSWHFVGDESQS